MLNFLEALIKCKYNSNFLALLSISILLTQCDSQILRLIEGVEANTDFQYPCFSTKVTLQMGYRAPFYNSMNQDSTSLPQRYKLKVQNDTENDICSIHLMINPVTRNDAGTCILTVYQGGEILDEYTKKIELHVKYPPDKALCELSQEYTVGDWVSLHCTAPVGTLPGEIKCYQHAMRIPPVAKPVQTDQTLEQTFWVMQGSYPTFCCTSTQEQPTERCDCKDFVWDPSNETIESNTTIDPCPKISAHSPPSQISGNSAAQPLDTNLTMTTLAKTQTKQKRYLLTILCMFIPVFVIVIVFIVISVFIIVKGKRKDWKNKKLKKKKSNSLDKAVYMKLPKA